MLGSIMVGTVLVTNDDISITMTTLDELVSVQNNSTVLYSELEIYDYGEKCGVNNCPQTTLNFAQSKPTQASIYALFASLVILCILSIGTTVFFMDNLNEREELDESNKKQNKFSLKIIGKIKY